MDPQPLHPRSHRTRSLLIESGSSLADKRPLDWTGFLQLALFGIWSLMAILPLQLLSRRGYVGTERLDQAVAPVSAVTYPWRWRW